MCQHDLFDLAFEEHLVLKKNTQHDKKIRSIKVSILKREHKMMSNYSYFIIIYYIYRNDIKQYVK